MRFAVVIAALSAATLSYAQVPTFSGNASEFTPSAAPACGPIPPAETFVGAVNPSTLSEYDLCGTVIFIAADGGRTLEVNVVDSCATCDVGDIKLNEPAFNEIAPDGETSVGVVWSPA